MFVHLFEELTLKSGTHMVSFRPYAGILNELEKDNVEKNTLAYFGTSIKVC